MKNVLAVALVCFVSISFAAGQQASNRSSAEDQIKVDQFEADDIITADPSGRVTDKTQDKTDLSSGDPLRVLSRADVLKLRKLRFQEREPFRMLAKRFGVSVWTAHRLCQKGCGRANSQAKSPKSDVRSSVLPISVRIIS